ncbi:MAG: hypothetical protein IIA67_11990 [Planctomycetes bacterium]|nr:hypothetical protein [Planctomycetota bacterium]
MLTGGNVSREGFTEILAIAQGIDVFAIKLEGIEQTSPDTTEQHSTEQSAHDRAVKLRDLELREQAISSQKRLLHTQEITLDAEREEYERLKNVFIRQQEQNRDTKDSENLATEVETIQNMKRKPAKELLSGMLDNGELDRVVSILFLMPIADRSKIVDEFKTQADLERLDEILKRIETGAKEGDAIRSTLKSLGGAEPTDAPQP